MPSIASDAKWQAESDARTLADAEKIKSDPKRYKAALKSIQEQCSALMDVMEDDAEEQTEPAAEQDKNEMKPGAMGKMAKM